jgi:hypothetical protein
VVRKQPIDEERVDGDDGEGEQAGDAEGGPNRDALVGGIGVLEGLVLQREVLVIRFGVVEDVENDDKDAAAGYVLARAIHRAWGTQDNKHENHIVSNIPARGPSVSGNWSDTGWGDARDDDARP